MGGERERRREGKHGEWGQGEGLAQWVQGGIDAPWRHMNGFGLQSAVGVDLRLVEHSVDTQNNYGEFKKKNTFVRQCISLHYAARTPETQIHRPRIPKIAF